MIAILKLGNYQSVQNALTKLNVKSIVTLDQNAIETCDALILPGVGEFGSVMQSLGDLTNVIKTYEKPFLGICAGMQVLFNASQESPGVTGLGIIKGNVEKFKGVITPQIGWNKLENIKSELFEKEDYVYYVNSYYCNPLENVTTSTSFYGTNFCASVQKNNFYGVQFHPEKSGEYGLKILQNFTRLSKCK